MASSIASVLLRQGAGGRIFLRGIFEHIVQIWSIDVVAELVPIIMFVQPKGHHAAILGVVDVVAH